MALIISDIDNCISHDEHRIPKIDWKTDDMDKRYHRYHLDCANDAPVNLEYLEGHDVVFFTAMPAFYKDFRKAWLRLHGIKYKNIFFRADGDHRPSAELKKSMMVTALSLGTIYSCGQVVAAYDDRRDVIDMYRDTFGINGIVLAAHDPEQLITEGAKAK